MVPKSGLIDTSRRCSQSVSAKGTSGYFPGLGCDSLSLAVRGQLHGGASLGAHSPARLRLDEAMLAVQRGASNGLRDVFRQTQAYTLCG